MHMSTLSVPPDYNFKLLGAGLILTHAAAPDSECNNYLLNECIFFFFPWKRAFLYTNTLVSEGVEFLTWTSPTHTLLRGLH